MIPFHDVELVSSHAGRDIGRYAVNGIYIEKGGAAIVATDSRRMARIVRDCGSIIDSIERNAIVHLGALPSMPKLIRGITSINGTIQALIDGAQASQVYDVSYCELIGDFPDHRRIYPTGETFMDYGKSRNALPVERITFHARSIQDGVDQLLAQTKARNMEFNESFIRDAVAFVRGFLTSRDLVKGKTFSFSAALRGCNAMTIRADSADHFAESLVMPITTN